MTQDRIVASHQERSSHISEQRGEASGRHRVGSFSNVPTVTQRDLHVIWSPCLFD